MKAFILLACLAGALALTDKDIDYDNLVPVYETDEWKAAFPGRANIDTSKIEKPVYRRGSRVWGEAPFAREANLGEIPYQAGLLMFTSPIDSFCGASVISQNFVLSAAQCFPGAGILTIVELGNVDRNFMAAHIQVAQWILHQAFDPENSDNDIAVLRLVSPITFTDNIRPVRLPARSQRTLTFDGQLAQISGWGATGGILELNPIRNLRIGFAEVISQAACRIRFPSTSSDHTLCIDGTNVNFCGGDFGGPVTVRDADNINTQIGIPSFTQITGCTRGFPGGMTRVTFYLDWIAQFSDVVIRNEF